MKKGISDVLESVYEMDYVTVDTGVSGDAHLVGDNYQSHLEDMKSRMTEAASNLEFEEAARLRDEIRRLEGIELGLGKPGVSQSAAAAHGLSNGPKDSPGRMAQPKMQDRGGAKMNKSRGHKSGHKAGKPVSRKNK